MCNTELDRPGALLFGPPDPSDRCAKDHLCVKCYMGVITFIAEFQAERRLQP